MHEVAEVTIAVKTWTRIQNFSYEKNKNFLGFCKNLSDSQRLLKYEMNNAIILIRYCATKDLNTICLMQENVASTKDAEFPFLPDDRNPPRKFKNKAHFQVVVQSCLYT